MGEQPASREFCAYSAAAVAEHRRDSAHIVSPRVGHISIWIPNEPPFVCPCTHTYMNNFLVGQFDVPDPSSLKAKLKGNRLLTESIGVEALAAAASLAASRDLASA